MKKSLRTETPGPVEPASAATAALHGTPGARRSALPLAWEERPLKPRVVPIRIGPLPGTLWITNQPAAFRGFGINE